MKKFFSLIVFIVILYIFFVLWHNYETINIKKNTLKTQASDYLYEKYSKCAAIIDVDYYDSVYFFNNVHFDKEYTKFQVRYITSTPCFEDDYLEAMLASELKTII